MKTYRDRAVNNLRRIVVKILQSWRSNFPRGFTERVVAVEIVLLGLNLESYWENVIFSSRNVHLI